jgi:foldase protein PrsA
MKSRRSLLTSGLLVAPLVLATLAGCGSSSGSSTITVDGGNAARGVIHVASNSISPEAIDHWIEIAAATSPIPAETEPAAAGPPYTSCIASAMVSAKLSKGHNPSTPSELTAYCEERYDSLRDQAAGFLISSDWLLGEASSLGLSVSDAEVKSDLDKSHPKPGELQKYLSRAHQTLADALLLMKLELLTSKIKQKILTDKQPALIQKYYRENISQFSTGETRTVLMIQTNTEAQAKQAKAAIQSGRSFASAAGRFSIEPEAKTNGGLFTGITKDYFVKPVGELLDNTKKGVLTGPIEGAGLYWLFKVLSTKPETRQTLQQAEPKIKQQIASTEQESVVNEFATQFQKKWTAKTDCRSSYLVPDCKGYKAPNTTALAKSLH